MRSKIQLWLVVPGLLWLAGCSDGSQPATAPAAEASPVARGGALYRQHCANCHGANAEGAPDWHRQGADGKLPPPPLDASGHVWHHPKAWLVQTIRDGTVKRGGNMPAWGGVLKDDEIEAVIAWVQARWPQEVYESWLRMDATAAVGHKH